MGHVRMMAATQPHLSGAISKTVNMPESATLEEVEKIYFEGRHHPGRGRGTLLAAGVARVCTPKDFALTGIVDELVTVDCEATT
jgi:ribonucleotide reductase alpha subunit